MRSPRICTRRAARIHTGTEIKRRDELPPARAYIFDTSPRALARIAELGNAYDNFRYGASVFKIDYALDGPVPWTSEQARRAGTVHVGPTAGPSTRLSARPSADARPSGPS